MEKSTLRSAALWTTIVFGVISLFCGLVPQMAFWFPGVFLYEFGNSTHRVLSLISSFSYLIHLLALFTFLAIVHKDLKVAERWAIHARDYIIRDNTGRGPEF
jgi:hypothetical protein